MTLGSRAPGPHCRQRWAGSGQRELGEQQEEVVPDAGVPGACLLPKGAL